MKTPPPPPGSLRVKRKNVRQVRKHLCLNRVSGPKTAPTTVVQRQEMAAYFRLLDDDVIHDFLRADCCYKMTDKYLLAMTFVYFKRARFPLAEYTRINFFIALYLANTMEEDEEESKYEIFPWALGRSWRRNFPRFLRERDELWTRIQHRAAVSRRCCQEVMAIVSCHPAWSRRRSDLHSGAQRRYGAPPAARFPRGPSVAVAPCEACCRGNGPASTSSPASGRPPQGGVNGPFPSAVGPEKTPPPTGHAPSTGHAPPTGHAPSIGHAPSTGHAPSIGHAPQPPAPGRFWPEELPRDPSSCSSACDAFMDWINEM